MSSQTGKITELGLRNDLINKIQEILGSKYIIISEVSIKSPMGERKQVDILILKTEGYRLIENRHFWKKIGFNIYRNSKFK